MIKVLFLIPTLGHGGAERVLVNLVNHMNQDEFSITIQTMFDVGIYRDKIRDGIRYIGGFPWYFRGNTWVFKVFSSRMLYRLYIREHYDIIVSFLEGPSARVAAGCCDPKTKLVSWVHVEQPDEKYVCKVFRSFTEARACYLRFDRTIAVAKTVASNFDNLFKLPQKTGVLYNVVETEDIRLKARERFDDVLFSTEEINLCSVAKLTAVKGYDRLITVVARLRAEGYPLHLYLIGKGEEQEKLRRIAAENHIIEAVTFVGFRNNPYQYVAASDLFVCSSYREGFSTAVTEAVIVGTPVVSTNCSGATELLGLNNEYGIVTTNDLDGLYAGIKQMISIPGLLTHYRGKAKERGRQFSTERTVYAVEQMLKEVATG